MNTKRNGEGTPIFLLASLTAMKRRLRKRGEARKYLAALALALCVVAGLFPSGVITARADAWPEALESTTGYGMYVINKGGVYDCPSSVKGQVQISGGTSSNPVEIRISGTVTSPWSSTPDLECRSEGYPLFVVRSGYVKFVGSNNATITCEDSHVLSVASLLIGYANLQVSNLTLEGNNGGAFAPVDLGSQDYEMDSTFTNVTIQNWAGSDIGASVQINGGRHNFQNCKFSNNRGFNVGGLVTVSGQTTMKNCVFTQCSSMANSGGGAIDVSNGATLTLEDCTISECGTDSVGGAVHLE